VKMSLAKSQTVDVILGTEPAAGSIAAKDPAGKMSAAKKAPANEPAAKIMQSKDVPGSELSRPGAPAEEQPRVEGINWLKDDSMLPKEIPGARITWFEYPSVVHSPESLDLVAVELLRCLREMRTKTENQPIIFIGHALGGIIIEKALSANSLEAKPILHSTAGIVFLATPFGVTGLFKDRSTYGNSLDAYLTRLKHFGEGGQNQLSSLLKNFVSRIEGEGASLVWFYSEVCFFPD
jgi:hypothetical protein